MARGHKAQAQPPLGPLTALGALAFGKVHTRLLRLRWIWGLGARPGLGYGEMIHRVDSGAPAEDPPGNFIV